MSVIRVLEVKSGRDLLAGSLMNQKNHISVWVNIEHDDNMIEGALSGKKVMKLENFESNDQTNKV